jgi:heat shock protein HslJ
MPHPDIPRHSKLATGSLTMLLLLGLAGCAGPAVETSPARASSQAPKLVGSEWRLQDMNGRTVLDGVNATLAFPEVGRVSGSGSCNRFTGSVSTDTNLHMQLSQIASTRMACAGAIGEQESRYLAALQQVHHYEVQGRQLLLYVQGENLPLRFERTRP